MLKFKLLCIVCENCGKCDVFIDADFDSVINQLKDNGWHIMKIGDTWLDFCSKKCFEEYMTIHS